MALLKKNLNLQLFAEGAAGDGGAGADGGQAADTGAQAADPGRQRLLELGVPESKLRKNRVYGKPTETVSDQPAEQQESEQQSPSADDTKPTEEKPSRMSWEDIKNDPEYSKNFKDEMSAAIQGRLKGAKAKETAMEQLAPALEILAKRHGMDLSKPLDYEALSKAVCEDDSLYDDKALELGVSRETAKKLEQYELGQARQEREKAEQAQLQQEQARQQVYAQHLTGLRQQEQALKQQFPDFSLDKEMQNPAFMRMTSPAGGVTVEAAYYALHHKEIDQRRATQVAQQTAVQLSETIQSNSQRPKEGSSFSQAPSVKPINYRNMTAAQRQSLRDQIYAAAAKGRKLRPGEERWG